jgi:hypothetical protein
MANIQIRGEQVKDATLSPAKLDLAQTYDFTSGVVQVATPSNGSDAATKAYVDSLVADGFQAGDGIAIDTATSPDTISVKLAATNPMLQFVGTGTDELQVKLDANKGLTSGPGGLFVQLKSETGGSISVDANGLYLADSAISNAKLANFTISGKALGANLDGLSAGASSAISMTSYNGSAAVSDIDVKYDNTTVGKNGSNQLEVKDDSIVTAKLGISSYLEKFTANGAQAQFDLANTIDSKFAYIQVFKNGLLMEQVASSPSGKDEFSLSLTGGPGGVSQVAFGTAPTSGDLIRVMYLAD